MIGAIEAFMTADHARLDRLLERAERKDGTIDLAAYAVFREGLLRHIAMEEKVLLPFARAKRSGTPLPIARALRQDHGRIAKLLVPTPDSALCAELRLLLAKHNELEEGPRGLYATCDALAGDEAGAVVERLGAQPAVPVAPHYDGPLLQRSRQRDEPPSPGVGRRFSNGAS
ncbi:MAG TPA: hemerythrin domain-containing protein [Labilithrix sp.]|nr:hemerythrin domain-containing protein [Labilithrix sp.]